LDFSGRILSTVNFMEVACFEADETILTLRVLFFDRVKLKTASFIATGILISAFTGGGVRLKRIVSLLLVGVAPLSNYREESTGEGRSWSLGEGRS